MEVHTSVKYITHFYFDTKILHILCLQLDEMAVLQKLILSTSCDKMNFFLFVFNASTRLSYIQN